jgi:ribonucleoside-diphosphate reductase alpha chain
MEVGAWVYENFDKMSGVSFLPYADHSYRQAPYQDCTSTEYLELIKKMPKNVEWAKLSEYESVDMTTSSQELACSADGGCEIVDLTSVA